MADLKDILNKCVLPNILPHFQPYEIDDQILSVLPDAPLWAAWISLNGVANGLTPHRHHPILPVSLGAARANNVRAGPVPFPPEFALGSDFPFPELTVPC